MAISVLVCIYAVPALGTVEVIIGGTTITAATTTVLAAGLLGAKVLGLGLGLGLASRGVWLTYFVIYFDIPIQKCVNIINVQHVF